MRFPLMFRIFLLLGMTLSMNLAIAQHQEYHLKLLAVQEAPAGLMGSDADLLLEIQPGSGRVFLETFPLTKLDTQISTRFAKDVACHYYDLDCQKYDFIYTIKAKSNIIGGPSAGAAIAALTAIAMMDLDYDSSLTITATMNSGGILGPVGGTKEKLEAASRAGIRKVLIAQGSGDYEAGNTTLDLLAYGRENLSIEVTEVIDLNGVLFQLTGKNLSKNGIKVVENEEYTTIMQGLQQQLCERSEKLQEELKEEGVALERNNSRDIQKKQEAARNYTQQKDYYSAASTCFGNNVALKAEFYQQKHLNSDAYQRLFDILEKKVQKRDAAYQQRDAHTISDIQTLMIVQERLDDVRQQIEKFKNETVPPEDPAPLLAYAEERYVTAVSWEEFFSMKGKAFQLSQGLFEQSCLQKISEGQERHQYASLFFGEGFLQGIQKKIRQAEEALQKKRPTLCLMLAAQAKADANALLSTLGLPEDHLAAFLKNKQMAVERVIATNTAEGMFPILGYSYYQYGRSLQEAQPYNALVYFEYALEMSDLGMYFPEEAVATSWLSSRITAKQKAWLYVMEGFIIGVLVGGLVMLILGRRKKRNGKKG